jgi:transcriptional regulator with XRE-family HTH domain
MKTKDPKLAEETGRRLRAIQAELTGPLGMETIDDFAEVLGVGRNTVSNWLNGYHPPGLHAMLRLCDQKGFTLDWIYRGRSEGLPYDKSVRLTALVSGMGVGPLSPELPPEGSQGEVLVVEKTVRKKAKANAGRS